MILKNISRKSETKVPCLSSVPAQRSQNVPSLKSQNRAIDPNRFRVEWSRVIVVPLDSVTSNKNSRLTNFARTTKRLLILWPSVVKLIVIFRLRCPSICLLASVEWVKLHIVDIFAINHFYVHMEEVWLPENSFYDQDRNRKMDSHQQGRQKGRGGRYFMLTRFS